MVEVADVLSFEQLERLLLISDLLNTRYAQVPKQRRAMLEKPLRRDELEKQDHVTAVTRELESVATLGNSAEQATVFLMLHEKIGTANTQKAFKIAQEIADPHDRVLTMGSIASTLSASQVVQVLADVDRLGVSETAVAALWLLLPYLSEDMRQHAYAILNPLTSSIAAEEGGLGRLAVLSASEVRHLINHKAVLGRMIREVGEIPDGRQRALAARNILVGLREERFSTLITEHRSAIDTLILSASREEMMKWRAVIDLSRPEFWAEVLWKEPQTLERPIPMRNVDPVQHVPLAYRSPSGPEGDVTPSTKPPPKRQRTPSELPDEAPRLWVRRTRGRPAKGEGAEKLLDFISKVYGRYIPKFRNELRSYIRRKDPALYTAIASYEALGGVLPPELWLPTQRDISDERLARAKRGELPVMPVPERRKVKRRLWRADKALKN